VAFAKQRLSQNVGNLYYRHHHPMMMMILKWGKRVVSLKRLRSMPLSISGSFLRNKITRHTRSANVLAWIDNFHAFNAGQLALVVSQNSPPQRVLLDSDFSLLQQHIFQSTFPLMLTCLQPFFQPH